MNKQSNKVILIVLGFFFSGILAINLAHAYHIFVVNSGSQRLAWATPSAFLTDNTGVSIPGTRPGSDGAKQWQCQQSQRR